MNNHINRTLLSAFAFLILPAISYAQLADTIWTGNAKVTIPKLNFYSDGNLLADPKTVSALSMIIPVEIWFWDSSTFIVSMDMRKLDAGPDTPDLQPLFGEWIIPLGARIGSLAGVTVVPYGLGDYFEQKTGSYSFNAKSKKGTFQAQQKDTVIKDFDVGDITPGCSRNLKGSFRLQGANTMKVTGTTFDIPNPIGPSSRSAYVGSGPIIEVTLVRHPTRTPRGSGVAPYEP